MEKDEAKETWLPEVRVVHARGITNGMVFTNANKHFYQLQNDSPGCLSISNADPTRSSLPLSSSSPIPPIYRATSLFPPLFLHVDDELLITRIPRVISRTIVPSPGLRKYLTLEGWEGKKRTRSSESDRAVDGNGNRGNKKTKMNTVVNRWRRVEEGERGKTEGWLEVLPPPRWRLISPKSTERQIPERNVAG